MGMILTAQDPLTEQEVLDYLNKKVEAEEKRWGADYIYAKWARESRDKLIEEFRKGFVIPVYSVSYVESYGNGSGDFEDTLYSDGHVRTSCYGYCD